MDISEVAKRSGLRASTLRYYEEKGLVSSVGQPGERQVEQLPACHAPGCHFGCQRGRVMPAVGGEVHARPHMNRCSPAFSPPSTT